MIAATSPASTVRSSPRMISVPVDAMRAWRFLISSILVVSQIVAVANRVVGVVAGDQHEPDRRAGRANDEDPNPERVVSCGCEQPANDGRCSDATDENPQRAPALWRHRIGAGPAVRAHEPDIRGKIASH